MKKKLILVLTLIFAFAMIMGACSNNNKPAKADETYDFTINVSLGEPISPNWSKLFAELETKSNGKLKTTNNIYWGGSLIPIPEVPKGLGAGNAAFSNIPSPNYPDILPLNTRILNLPFLGLQDPVESSEIWMQLYKEFPEMQAEFESWNIKIVGVTTLGMYGLHFVDTKPVKTPADLKGRKIVPYSQTFLPLLQANDAAGQYIPPGQIYESLEKGVVDGYVNNWAFQGWFGLSDLMHQHVDLSQYGAFHEWNILGMNLDFYNNLPKDLQQLIDDTFWNNGGYKLLWEDTWNIVLNEQKKSTDRGDVWTVLNEQESKVWKDALLPIHDSELADIAAKAGDVAYKIYDRAKEIIAEKYGK